MEDVWELTADQKRGVPPLEKRWMHWRTSVEPVIAHLKSDGRMRRCSLKGVLGDSANVLLCACGHNLRKLLRRLCFSPKNRSDTALSALQDALLAEERANEDGVGLLKLGFSGAIRY